MNWEGRISWAESMSDGRVRVGGHYVPSKVTMTATGDGGSPDLRFVFTMSEQGEARCVSAHVDASPNGRGVATADLALIAVDQLTVAAFEQLAQEVLYEDERGLGTAYSGPISGSSQIRRSVDKGKRSKTNELALVARAYAEADRAPTQAVVDRVGLPRRTAGRRINEAREQGLLPATGEPITDEHRERIARTLKPDDEGGIGAFESPAAFDAWWERTASEVRARKAQARGDDNE